MMSYKGRLEGMSGITSCLPHFLIIHMNLVRFCSCSRCLASLVCCLFYNFSSSNKCRRIHNGSSCLALLVLECCICCNLSLLSYRCSRNSKGSSCLALLLVCCF